MKNLSAKECATGATGQSSPKRAYTPPKLKKLNASDTATGPKSFEVEIIPLYTPYS